MLTLILFLLIAFLKMFDESNFTAYQVQKIAILVESSLTTASRINTLSIYHQNPPKSYKNPSCLKYSKVKKIESYSYKRFYKT